MQLSTATEYAQWPTFRFSVAFVLALAMAPSNSRAAQIQSEEVASAPGANIQHPVWSPDGKRLSYESNHHGNMTVELFAGEFSSREFKRVTPLQTSSGFTAGFGSSQEQTKVVHELTWSHDSQLFAYSATNEAEDFDIFLSSGEVLASGPATEDSPQWSPVNRSLLFTSSRTGNGDLFHVNLDTSEVTSLPSDPISSDISPSWDHTGENFVWVSHGKQGDDILISGMFMGPPRAVHSAAAGVARPTFSPNGSKIAFYQSPIGTQRFDLMMVDLNAGPTAKVIATDVVVNHAGPGWVSDSMLICVLNNDTQFDPAAVINVITKHTSIMDLGTVNHGDYAIAITATGEIYIAFVAQGRVNDENRDFKRLFVADISSAIQ